MIYLLTVKEILILSNNIYLFTKSIIIRGKYISDTKIIFISRNRISLRVSRKYILVQRIFIYSFMENYIHSRKYIYLRNIYSFKFKAICSFKENYIYWTLLHSRNSRNIYSKIAPSHFMIIISFTITISWIKYSYKFFSVEGWRNCWYDWGFRIITHCPCRFCHHRAKKYHPKRFPLPTLREPLGGGGG